MKILLLLLVIAVHLDAREKHGVSYVGGSRFGDRMSLYLQARYLSEISGLPFLQRSFLYSDGLTIEYDALPYSLNVWNYKKSSVVSSSNGFLEFFRSISDSGSTLFHIGYTVDTLPEWETFADGSFLIHLPDNFLAEARVHLVPKIPIPTLTRPGILNVAAHVRILSGEDTPQWSFVKFPLRCANVNYHRRQIERIYEWNLHQPMYVFLFSDTKKPLELLEDFQSYFQGTNIEFGIRDLQQVDVNHVVEDFFAMQQFDVLVSTQSSFSKTASKLGDFDLVIYPVHHKEMPRGEKPLPSEIDQVQIISKKSEWFPFTLDCILRENNS